eukprot:CAMPEP_0113451628 /NCGR_PEP_ID=MMETSP0014_2-20120614/6434_1 /TAXON_ID=2857 /ORGANISM="Nitzschia sp." /LENGTH=561 /DNA_ID=CAMNT_0000342985 /DNA_START=182 /DNA_END=1868 /DNA_ORIENTATION=+ /assembly_acc=CAM_ASM_000159
MDDQQLSRNNYRVAVITGASRGIGRGIAYELGLDETMSWVDTVLAGLLEPAGKALEANTNVENLGYGSMRHIIAVVILSLCVCKQSRSWTSSCSTIAKTRASSVQRSSSPSSTQSFLSLSPSSSDEMGKSMDDQHLSRNNYRVAVVTGASRGIGRGIAYELGLDETTSWVVYCVGRSTRSCGGGLGGKHQRRKSWSWPTVRRRRQVINEVGSEIDRPPPSPRTVQLLDDQRPVDPTLDLSVESIAEEITSSSSSRTNSIGIPVPCDLSEDEAVAAIFDQVRQKHGRLDLLVCSAYATPPQPPPDEPETDTITSKATNTGLRGNFWDQSIDMWDAVNGIGLRQVYACCREAAPLMIETAAMFNVSATEPSSTSSSPPPPPPLICFVSSFGGKSYTFNVAYGVGKAGVDRMALDMSYQLSEFGVATTSLYPGLVKTEANMQMEIDGTWDEASGGLDLSQGETPRFSGRALVQLTKVSKDEMMKRSGQVEVVAELAREFGFTDVDQSRPPSIRSLRYLLPNFVFPSIEKESDQPIPEWVKSNVPDILLPWSVFSSGPPPEMDTR